MTATGSGVMSSDLASETEICGHRTSSQLSTDPGVWVDTVSTPTTGVTTAIHTLPLSDSDRIAAYAPHLDPAVWAEIGPFVRDAVADAHTDLAQPVNELLNAVRAHVVWIHTVGHPLERDVVFDRFVIEEFIANNRCGYKPATRNAMRSTLFRMSEVLCGTESTIPRYAPIDGTRTGSVPYTTIEVTALRTMTQRRCHTPAERTMRLFLAFGLGAGLDAEDIKPLRVEHIGARGGVVFIAVPAGRRPARTVALDPRWNGDLAALLAALPDDGPVLGVSDVTVTPHRVSTLSSVATGDVSFSPRRLRTTWVVHHLTIGTPIKTLMAAGGFTNLTALDRFLPHVPEPDPLTALAYLTGQVAR